MVVLKNQKEKPQEEMEHPPHRVIKEKLTAIYSNSYYGSGKGVGTGNGSWGLNGRRLSSPGAVKADCNDEGTIVVEVKVNKNGGVTNAKYSPSGSNTTSTCLKEAAIKSAYKYKWNNDENAPDTQIGLSFLILVMESKKFNLLPLNLTFVGFVF
ncbi:energy transducer TonB [Flavobacterium piscinae]|uniref:hypothetical protein n=1 Tax=Flavobacterium piscinae TaxID=2506424 RepID=UPI002AAAB0A8|nr:hypothetical protein [Flavobacterium piscinae]